MGRGMGGIGRLGKRRRVEEVCRGEKDYGCGEN